MPRVHSVKKARKAHRCGKCGAAIEKGQPYYWWQHKLSRGGLRKNRCQSCGYPKRSDLTLSPFYSALYDIEDSFVTPDAEDLQSAVEELISQIEGLREECEERLESMPEALQETSDSGMMLQERIGQLDEWISELESIDTDLPDDLTEDELEDWVQDRVDEIESANPF